ncbi:MAG: hypothetical protein AABZ39_04880 [Spirochaetota bacterium]
MQKQIKSIEALRQLANSDSGVEVFIVSMNGGLRSSKHVYWTAANGWSIYNLIDDTFQDASTDRRLNADTLIVKAMKLGALYADAA